MNRGFEAGHVSKWLHCSAFQVSVFFLQTLSATVPQLWASVTGMWALQACFSHRYQCPCMDMVVWTSTMLSFAVAACVLSCVSSHVYAGRAEFHLQNGCWLASLHA